MIYRRPDIKNLFESEKTIADFFAIQGKVFRRYHNRHTLRFERDGRGFYVKCHGGIGWREIAKQLTHLRWPQFGAQAERAALKKLEQLDVSTMRIAAYGEQGSNPVTRRSFIITDEIAPAISLEDLCRDWPRNPPVAAFKNKLVRQVASMARRMHDNGVNHRDFYICHFLLKGLRPRAKGQGVKNCELQIRNPQSEIHNSLYLIDLHRVQIRRRTPQRWIIKDIVGLYFSAMDIGLTRRDLLRFIRAYTGQSLRTALKTRALFWGKVQARADRLYRKEWRRQPPRPRDSNT